MGYNGGLAKVEFKPIGKDKIEVRVEEAHFFDLVREGEGWAIKYKISKKNYVLGNLADLQKGIMPLPA